MVEKKYIQSIERAYMITDYIARKKSAKLNEICDFTKLKTSTAFGILQTLEHTGQITKSVDGLTYSLGFNTLRFGLSYLNDSNINYKINTLLNEIVKEIDETAYFEIQVDKNKFYYLDCVVSSQPLKVVPDEKKYINLPDNSAVAKLFNANEELEYATDLEEVNEGLNCFAMPYKTGGKLVGCVALTGPSYRFTKEKMENAHQSYIKIMKRLGLENHI
jgi:IclR family transcriptional regulator, acetate operon repressor